MDNRDVIISTRIRLARNLRNYPFPCKMSKEQTQQVVQKVKDAILGGGSVLADRFSFTDMSQLTQEQAVSLVERHLISPEFISDTPNKGLLLLDDGTVSIMINEEDHIRLQVILNGFALSEAYDIANKLDTMLDETLSLAFDDKLGYLTQCPTNLGTGMRASVMLHLPALQESHAMGRIAENLAKLGLTLRGTYGEGSEPICAMYQLSNQVTLGISEQTAIENLKNITLQLVSQEENSRKTLLENIRMQDIISRSYGILNYAKLISNDEAMKLLSNVRLGIAGGMIDGMDIATVDKLMIDIQPGTIMSNEGKRLSPNERDAARAKLISKAFSKK